MSTELKQIVSFYVNRLFTKGVMIDINWNPLVELKIILLLCRGVLFCVSSEISFRYFTTSSFRRSRSSPLNKKFLETLTLSTVLNFGVVYFRNDLLYKFDKKSLFFTSLGDFQIDRFLRQFNVETNCWNLGTNFSP